LLAPRLYLRPLDLRADVLRVAMPPPGWGRNHQVQCWLRTTPEPCPGSRWPCTGRVTNDLSGRALRAPPRAR
jgi:hypothetical protein